MLSNPPKERQMSHWLFTPWKWMSRRLWVAAFITLPFVYFLSAMPVAYLSNQLEMPDKIDTAIIRAYEPIWWCRANNKTARQVMDWEDGKLVEILGDWKLLYTTV